MTISCIYNYHAPSIGTGPDCVNIYHCHDNKLKFHDRLFNDPSKQEEIFQIKRCIKFLKKQRKDSSYLKHEFTAQITEDEILLKRYGVEADKSGCSVQ